MAKQLYCVHLVHQAYIRVLAAIHMHPIDIMQCMLGHGPISIVPNLQDTDTIKAPMGLPFDWHLPGIKAGPKPSPHPGGASGISPIGHSPLADSYASHASTLNCSEQPVPLSIQDHNRTVHGSSPRARFILTSCCRLLLPQWRVDVLEQRTLNNAMHLWQRFVNKTRNEVVGSLACSK